MSDQKLRTKTQVTLKQRESPRMESVEDPKNQLALKLLPTGPQEDAKDRTNRSKSTAEKPNVQNFAVEDYNASPKLAVKSTSLQFT
jgi:hypothetical protein